MFDVRYSNYFSSRLYANTSVTSSEVDSEYYPTQMTSSEVDSGYYPTQMERRDWSDSFVYVTIYNY